MNRSHMNTRTQTCNEKGKKKKKIIKGQIQILRKTKEKCERSNVFYMVPYCKKKNPYIYHNYF